MHTSRYQVFYICFIKIAYAFFAVLVFSKFTTLGDTDYYLNGEYIERNNLASTAYVMSVIGNALGQWGGFALCISLSVIGILYLLEKARLSYRYRVIVLVMITLPSFGVWTSVFSKEVFVLFFFCLSVGGLIDLYTRKRRFFSLVQMIGLMLLTYIKPHYSVSIYVSMIGLIVYYSGFRKELILALMVIMSGISCVLCVYYIDEIYYYTQVMPLHFSQDGGSTRHNTYWIDRWDFFTSLPIGAPMAFIGPTLMEAIRSPKLIPFMFEGFFLFGFLILSSWKSVFYKTNINVLGFLLVATFVLPLLLTHYPFGLFNPGSAVRYRSGFILPLCVFLLFLAQRNRPAKGG